MIHISGFSGVSVEVQFKGAIQLFSLMESGTESSGLMASSLAGVEFLEFRILRGACSSLCFFFSRFRVYRL